MRADMRYLITVKRLSDTQNEYGERDSGWIDVVANVFASKEPLLGKEYLAAEQVQSDVEVKFRCHWIDGITKAMRLHCDGEIYEILSAINPKGLNRELLLYCKKVFV